CVVRARARVTAEPVYVVEEAPPPPREERITVRPGYVWIRGRWERRGGEWEWRAGAWQRERRGYVWQPGHWERRGNRYYWVEGRWEGGGRARVERRTPPPDDVRDRREPGVRDRRGEADHTVSVHPSAPPPAPRPERIQSRRGYVWVGGFYRWRDGSYEWVAGHWERERRGFAWQPGHWERRGSHYVWIEGSWQRR
ncbi:MAG TPA: hypothetical protein VNO33_15920, partial [Kofleriaceae bacterium]|nr:hypothetical protein [Kofleriaceae bacterium]